MRIVRKSTWPVSRFLRTTHNFPDNTIVLFCSVTILVSQDPLLQQQDCSMMRRLNFVFRHSREA